MKQKAFKLAKPDRPNWAAAVERAASLLRQNPADTLSNTCQNVPLKFLPQLREEAEASLK
jgi:hypothetical protein